MATAGELAAKGSEEEEGKPGKEEVEGEEGEGAASASTEVKDPNRTKRATCEV